MTTKLITDVYDIDEFEDGNGEFEGLTPEVIHQSGFTKINQSGDVVLFSDDKSRQFFIASPCSWTENHLTHKYDVISHYALICFGRWASYDDLHIAANDQCFDYSEWKAALRLLLTWQNTKYPNEPHGDE